MVQAMRQKLNKLLALAITSVCGLPWGAAASPRADAPGPRNPSARQESSQPATRPTAPNPQRLNDLIALIEGQNSPQARLTGVRELLNQGWSEVPRRLVAILNGSIPAAKAAVCAGLADMPEALDAIYLDPLTNLLGDPDADVRNAAAAALAVSRDPSVAGRLKAVMLDADKPLPARLAAVSALGLTSRPEAVEALVQGLSDANQTVSDAALAELEHSTAEPFYGDPDQARKWWDARRSMSLSDWQALLIERLVRKDREAVRTRSELELRLGKVLREAYLRTPEAERPALLAAHLADSQAAVRLLGLELAQTQIADGKPLASDQSALIHALLADPDPAVRAAAVRTIAALREPADADRLLELLGAERTRDVRQALANALGYVGGVSAVGRLLELVRQRDGSCLAEAVGALGRLAERDVITPDSQDGVVKLLLEVFDHSTTGQAVLRERLMWAMTQVGDARFERAFVAALEPAETAIVRRAAARGLAGLAGAKAPEQLVALMADPDAVVRKIAVEAVGKNATSDAQLQALWGRLASAVETDDGVRQAAWKGALHILESRPIEAIEQWLTKLPDDADRGRRAADLLTQEEAALVAAGAARDRLAGVRARLAAQLAANGQGDDALRMYAKAFEDAHATHAADAARVSQEYLRLAVAKNRFDAALAKALRGANPGLDARAAWEPLRGDLEARLAGPITDADIQTISALRGDPPVEWPPDVLDELDRLTQRAREARSGADSRPASTPISRPDEKDRTG